MHEKWTVQNKRCMYTAVFQVTSFSPSELVAVDKVLNPLYHYQFQARTLVQVSTPVVGINIVLSRYASYILSKNNSCHKFPGKPCFLLLDKAKLLYIVYKKANRYLYVLSA